jgi:hypothetical protein
LLMNLKGYLLSFELKFFKIFIKSLLLNKKIIII